MSDDKENGVIESPLRFMVFDERPDCLVVYLDRGVSLRLPELPYPFEKEPLAKALADAGVDCRVTTGTPGQWIKSYKALHAAERAERGQRQALKLASKNTERRGSGILAARDRADAIERKDAVDRQIRDLKAELSEARTRAYATGRYMDGNEFRAKERRLVELKEQSQALQVRIGELRKAEHAARDDQYRIYSERFMQAAHEILSEDVLQRIHGHAVEDEQDERR